MKANDPWVVVRRLRMRSGDRRVFERSASNPESMRLRIRSLRFPATIPALIYPALPPVLESIRFLQPDEHRNKKSRRTYMMRKCEIGRCPDSRVGLLTLA
jgi:hypothetical protein